MMELQERNLTSIDLFAVTYCSTITLGIAFLPYIGGEEIRSSWLKLFVAVLPYILFIILVDKFCKKYESYDFFSELKTKVWKWLFVIIVIYFIASTYSAIFMGVEGLISIVKVYLLPSTDDWVLAFLFFIVVAVGLLYGVQTITRMITAIIFFEIVVIISIGILIFNDYFDWIYVQPVWTTDVITFLKSSTIDMVRFGGVVALLSFLPYMKKGTKILKPAGLGLFFVFFSYLLVSIVVLGTFGFEQSLTLFSPVIALVQSLATRTGVFERTDLFFLGFWIIAYYKIMLVHSWFIIFMANKLYKEKKPGLYAGLLLLSLLFIIAFTPSFIEQSWFYINLNYIIYSAAVPIFLLSWVIIKKKKGAT